MWVSDLSGNKLNKYVFFKLHIFCYNEVNYTEGKCSSLSPVLGSSVRRGQTYCSFDLSQEPPPPPDKMVGRGRREREWRERVCVCVCEKERERGENTKVI